MTRPIAIGMVGAGFVAHIHARGYQMMRDINVRIAGVTAAPVEQAEAFARQYGIEKTAADFEALLAMPEIDIIDLCVPNHLHAPFSVAAAQAGKHIICEKPLTGFFGDPALPEPVGATPKCVMLEEATRTGEHMIAAAATCGVRLMYAENWLYSPVVQKALRLARSSGGTILEMRAQECHSGSHAGYARSWRYAGGGALMRLGAHPLGAALYLKEQEGLARHGKPIRVRSVVAETCDVTRTPSFQAERDKWIVTGWEDVENWATMILTFEDCTHATIFASDAVVGGMTDTLELNMSNARISCDLTHSGMIRAFAPDASVFAGEHIAEKLETKAGWSFPSFDEEWLLGYPQELHDFVQSVTEDRPPLSTGRLGLDVVRVTYAAYQSAEEGRRIEL
jgi:predicted dehydrogenase